MNWDAIKAHQQAMQFQDGDQYGKIPDRMASKYANPEVTQYQLDINDGIAPPAPALSPMQRYNMDFLGWQGQQAQAPAAAPAPMAQALAPGDQPGGGIFGGFNRYPEGQGHTTNSYHKAMANALRPPDPRNIAPLLAIKPTALG